MGRFASERLSALVVGGQHPFDRLRSPMRAVIREAMARGPEAVVAAIAPMAISMPAGFTARAGGGDHEAYAAMSFDEAGAGQGT
jgi:hypothetical protein